MKDEIREILDYLKKKENTRRIKCITTEESKQLLDYITNLQQQLHQTSLDIQELTEKDIGCPSWCDKLTNLQQEKEDYKSRCEKAIEYIRSNEWIKDYEISNCRTHLLNILQNGWYD